MDKPDRANIVQAAYHTARGAELAREAADAFGQAEYYAKKARDTIVDGSAVGKRHMDWGGIFADLHHAQSVMFKVPTEMQQRQCEFNVNVLGNRPVTQAELDVYGAGCR